MKTFGNNKKISTALFAEDIIKQIKSLEKKSRSTLSQIILDADLKKVLILNSSSSFRAKSFCNLIIENFSDLISPLEVIKIIGSTVSSENVLTEIKDRIRNQGLFSKAKVVILQDFSEIKAKYQAVLVDEIKNSVETLVIIPVNGEVPKSLDALKTDSLISSLSVLSGPKLEKWIENESLKLGTNGCEPSGINLLIKNFGSENLDQIAKILEKASLLTEPGLKISEAEIRPLLKATIEKDMLEIFESIARKDQLGLSIAINSLIKSGSHPLQIFTFINKAIKSLIVSKDSSGGLEKSKDLHNPWFLKKLSPNMFSEKRLIDSLPVLAKLEFELKNNSLTENVVLNQFLSKI